MPFEKKPEPKPIRWEILYEDEDAISIWKYNSKKFANGPIEVDYKYKRGYHHPGRKKKTIKDLIDNQKKDSENS